MAQIDYGPRFTDAIYATKQDVSKALNTSLIDSFWEQVIRYRSTYQSITSLKTIARSPYRITFTPSTMSRIADTRKKVNLVVPTFLNFQGTLEENNGVKKELLKKIVQKLANKYNILIASDKINAIVEGNTVGLSNTELTIANYVKTLKNIADHYCDPISEESISFYYATLTNTLNGFVLYRENEIQSASRSVGRDYQSAPANMIEMLMSNLIDFVSRSTNDDTIKATALLYDIYLIKPFDNLNEELAVLMAKFYLAHTNKNELFAYIPLEDFLIKNQDRLKNIVSEGQKLNDLTYIILHTLEILTNTIDQYINTIENYKLDKASEEYRHDELLTEDGELNLFNLEEAVEDSHEEVYEQEIIHEPNTEVKDKIEITKKEDSKPDEESIINEPVKKEEKVVEKIIEKVIIKEEKPIELATQVEKGSFTVPKQALQMHERDAQKFEKYLLETDPMLKKAQAHFYARHCTLGRYYTIQEYKKTMHVVYETARTSMDNLASLGYYKKEQIKNKFVYTPIKKD